MKSPTDTQTQELKLDGQPIIDFDEHEAWPMPKANPTPQTPKDRITEPFKKWLEKLSTS